MQLCPAEIVVSLHSVVGAVTLHTVVAPGGGHPEMPQARVTKYCVAPWTGLHDRWTAAASFCEAERPAGPAGVETHAPDAHAQVQVFVTSQAVPAALQVSTVLPLHRFAPAVQPHPLQRPWLHTQPLAAQSVDETHPQPAESQASTTLPLQRFCPGVHVVAVQAPDEQPQAHVAKCV
jgi:hypothetical protein